MSTKKRVVPKKKVKKTIEFEVLFEPDFTIKAPSTPTIFTATEREIILADMAYLKQKDIDSGAQAIWDKDQAKWKNFNETQMATMSQSPTAEEMRTNLQRYDVVRAGDPRLDQWGALVGCTCDRCEEKRPMRRPRGR